MWRNQGVKWSVEPFPKQRTLLWRLLHMNLTSWGRRSKIRRRHCAGSRWLKCTEARWSHRGRICGWGPRFHGSANHVLPLSLEWHDAAPELDRQVEELRSGGASGAPARRLHTWRKGEPVGADWPLWSGWSHSALWSFGGRFYLLNRSSKHTDTRTTTADVYVEVNIMFDSFGVCSWCKLHKDYFMRIN